MDPSPSSSSSSPSSMIATPVQPSQIGVSTSDPIRPPLPPIDPSPPSPSLSLPSVSSSSSISRSRPASAIPPSSPGGKRRNTGTSSPLGRPSISAPASVRGNGNGHRGTGAGSGNWPRNPAKPPFHDFFEHSSSGSDSPPTQTQDQTLVQLPDPNFNNNTTNQVSYHHLLSPSNLSALDLINPPPAPTNSIHSPRTSSSSLVLSDSSSALDEATAKLELALSKNFRTRWSNATRGLVPAGSSGPSSPKGKGGDLRMENSNGKWKGKEKEDDNEQGKGKKRSPFFGDNKLQSLPITPPSHHSKYFSASSNPDSSNYNHQRDPAAGGAPLEASVSAPSGQCTESEVKAKKKRKNAAVDHEDDEDDNVGPLKTFTPSFNTPRQRRAKSLIGLPRWIGGNNTSEEQPGAHSHHSHDQQHRGGLPHSSHGYGFGIGLVGLHKPLIKHGSSGVGGRKEDQEEEVGDDWFHHLKVPKVDIDAPVLGQIKDKVKTRIGGSIGTLTKRAGSSAAGIIANSSPKGKEKELSESGGKEGKKRRGSVDSEVRREKLRKKLGWRKSGEEEDLMKGMTKLDELKRKLDIPDEDEEGEGQMEGSGNKNAITRPHPYQKHQQRRSSRGQQTPGGPTQNGKESLKPILEEHTPSAGVGGSSSYFNGSKSSKSKAKPNPGIGIIAGPTLAAATGITNGGVEKDAGSNSSPFTGPSPSETYDGTNTRSSTSSVTSSVSDSSSEDDDGPEGPPSRTGTVIILDEDEDEGEDAFARIKGKRTPSNLGIGMSQSLPQSSLNKRRIKTDPTMSSPGSREALKDNGTSGITPSGIAAFFKASPEKLRKMASFEKNKGKDKDVPREIANEDEKDQEKEVLKISVPVSSTSILRPDAAESDIPDLVLSPTEIQPQPLDEPTSNSDTPLPPSSGSTNSTQLQQGPTTRLSRSGSRTDATPHGPSIDAIASTSTNPAVLPSGSTSTAASGVPVRSESASTSNGKRTNTMSTVATVSTSTSQQLMPSSPVGPTGLLRTPRMRPTMLSRDESDEFYDDDHDRHGEGDAGGEDGEGERRRISRPGGTIDYHRRSLTIDNPDLQNKKRWSAIVKAKDFAVGLTNRDSMSMNGLGSHSGFSTPGMASPRTGIAALPLEGLAGAGGATSRGSSIHSKRAKDGHLRKSTFMEFGAAAKDLRSRVIKPGEENKKKKVNGKAKKAKTKEHGSKRRSKGKVRDDIGEELVNEVEKKLAEAGMLDQGGALEEVDVLWQNQRGVFMFGAPKFTQNILFPLDPSEWTDTNGHDTPYTNYTHPLPTPAWRWEDEGFMVDMSLDVDEQGWQYAFAFHSRTWTGDPIHWQAFVRRKRWVRRRRRDGVTATPKRRMVNPEWADKQTPASPIEGTAPMPVRRADLEFDGKLIDGSPYALLPLSEKAKPNFFGWEGVIDARSPFLPWAFIKTQGDQILEEQKKDNPDGSRSDEKLWGVWRDAVIEINFQRVKMVIKKCKVDREKLDLWRWWLGLAPHQVAALDDLTYDDALRGFPTAVFSRTNPPLKFMRKIQEALNQGSWEDEDEDVRPDLEDVWDLLEGRLDALLAEFQFQVTSLVFLRTILSLHQRQHSHHRIPSATSPHLVLDHLPRAIPPPPILPPLPVENPDFRLTPASAGPNQTIASLNPPPPTLLVETEPEDRRRDPTAFVSGPKEPVVPVPEELMPTHVHGTSEEMGPAYKGHEKEWWISRPRLQFWRDVERLRDTYSGRAVRDGGHADEGRSVITLKVPRPPISHRYSSSI